MAEIVGALAPAERASPADRKAVTTGKRPSRFTEVVVGSLLRRRNVALLWHGTVIEPKVL